MPGRGRPAPDITPAAVSQALPDRSVSPSPRATGPACVPRLRAVRFRRLVRVRRRRRTRAPVVADLSLQVADRGLELGVLAAGTSRAGGCRRRCRDRRRAPRSATSLRARRRRSRPRWRCPCRRGSCELRQPDLAAPGARADDLAEAEPAEPLGERLAVGGGAFVARARPRGRGTRTACSSTARRRAAASRTRPCGAASRGSS